MCIRDRHETYVADARASADVHAGYAAQIGGPVYELMDAGTLPPLAETEDLGTIMQERRPPRAGDRDPSRRHWMPGHR